MKNYTVIPRKHIVKDKTGATKTTFYQNYYISYYDKKLQRGNNRVWVNTGVEYVEDDEDKKKAAEDFAKEYMAKLEKGTVYEFLKQNHWFEPANSPAFVDSRSGSLSWTLNYAQSRKNARYLQIILEEVKDPIGDCLFEKVSRKDTHAFRERLKNLQTYVDAKHTTRVVTNTFKNNVISAFRVTWKYYKETGIDADIENNPFRDLKKFKDVDASHKQKYIFTPDDYHDLFNRELLSSIIPVTTYKSKHDGSEKVLTKEKWDELINSFWIDFFELVFLTGARGGEIAALRVSSFPKEYEGYVMVIKGALKSGLRKNDVNNETEKVKVFDKTKTNTDRTIVLCSRARAIVDKYKEGKNPDDLLFSLPMKKTDNRFSTLLTSQRRAQAFSLFINEMEAQIGFPRNSNEVLTLHGFRTSLNTNLLAAGNKEWVVAAALGWESKSLTKTQGENYTKVDIPELIELAASISRIYFNEDFRWKPAAKKRAILDRSERVAQILNSSRKIKWINQFRKVLLEIRQEFFSGEIEYHEETVNIISEFLDIPVDELNKRDIDFFESVASRIRSDEEVSNYSEAVGSLGNLFCKNDENRWWYSPSPSEEYIPDGFSKKSLERLYQKNKKPYQKN